MFYMRDLSMYKSWYPYVEIWSQHPKNTSGWLWIIHLYYLLTPDMLVAIKSILKA